MTESSTFNTPSYKPISPGNIKLEGLLTKYSTGKSSIKAGNWQRRYFVLRDDLAYFSSQESYQNGKKVQ